MSNIRSDIAKVKDALRIPSSVTMYDDEITALCYGAVAVMESAGIDMDVADSDVVTTLKILYCKGTFGNRSDAERSLKTFDAIVKQQALATRHATEADG